MKPIPVPIIRPRAYTAQITDPGKESTTIILLNGYSIEWSPNDITPTD